jgi:hypothetical protein
MIIAFNFFNRSLKIEKRIEIRNNNFDKHKSLNKVKNGLNKLSNELRILPSRLLIQKN